MRGVKRIRPLICHPGRWHHSITSRSNGLGLLALALACGGGLVLARCQLSRDQGSLDRALAAVTALTRTAVAVSDSIGVPSTLSVKIIEAAEGVFRDVAALSRDAAYERLQKALLLIDFARIHTELGSSELARTRTSEADSLLQGLAAAHPNDSGWQRDVSIAYSKLGDLLKTQNRLEHAYAHYDASRAILEGHAAGLSAENKRRLAISFIDMGDVDIARGFLNEALSNYDQSLVIMDRLATAEPGNPDWRHGLVLSHRKIGDVLQLEGKLDEALVSNQPSSCAGPSCRRS
jgi:tetratricopeptide (TPR) repeat protein